MYFPIAQCARSQMKLLFALKICLQSQYVYRRCWALSLHWKWANRWNSRKHVFLGGGAHLLLALVIRLLTTNPVRDRAPFLFLIETPPTFGCSLRFFHKVFGVYFHICCRISRPWGTMCKKSLPECFVGYVASIKVSPTWFHRVGNAHCAVAYRLIWSKNETERLSMGRGQEK